VALLCSRFQCCSKLCAELWILGSPSVAPTDENAHMKRRVITWNVERLLRPTGSGLARALDATAASGWNRVAYSEKVDAIASVLRAACPNGPPAILSLVEVENGTVVRDVLAATKWQGMVDVVPDDEKVAGYDLALLYDCHQVRGHRNAASYSIGNRYSTRDILDATLDLGPSGPLRFVTVHWASRKMSNAEPLRIAARPGSATSSSLGS